MRFREHPVAVLADIEGMFMQIAIHQIDQSALRFLWLANNQIPIYKTHLWSELLAFVRNICF